MKKNLSWLAVLLAVTPICASAALAKRPNILLAIGDNWAWPHAGALGDAAAKTPVFDRIAREGMLFNHAFCPVPSCSPTRSSMLTGRWAHQLEDAASLWSAFPRKFRVFTDLLREGGYAVGFTGKGWSPGNYTDFGWKQNPVGQQYKTFDQFMQERDQDRPFFFWLGNVDTALHRWRKEAEGGTAPGADSVRVPPVFPDVPDVRKTLAAYYAGVHRMDEQIGAAIEALQQAGQLDHTVVVYTSDNGWQLPRGLANCYDTGCRVPLAIRWLGKVKPASKSDDFVSLTDLTPTFLEIAEIKPAPEMTARSFLDVLLGQPSAVNRDHVFLERERHANVRRGDLSYPIRGIRTKDFLYLWNLRPDRWPAGDPQAYWAVGDYGDVDPSPAKQYILDHATESAIRKFYNLSFAKRPAEELYDLRQDPDQLVNVAGRKEHAEAKRHLRARVEQWMRDTADPRVDAKYDGWDKYPYFGRSAAGKSVSGGRR